MRVQAKVVIGLLNSNKIEGWLGASRSCVGAVALTNKIS